MDDKFTVDTESGNGKIEVTLAQVHNSQDHAVAFWSSNVSGAIDSPDGSF
jgi:hypothetical protein